jgi:predicted ATPase
MRELPAGTVTFLFTDIEGSTTLLHELGEESYAEALAEHRAVLRDAFARHGGVEVDTQGDAFFVAFPTAPGALAAAREAQESLSIPVRMGLHTGTPLVTDEGYVGADVHRAARIAAAGHGRQVLVSASTHALLEPSSSLLLDLGEHRLKDLSAPERIYQAGEGEFPRLKTLYATNLPVPATPFLGRERELDEVAELLAREDVRLLALTGAGGSGKTRLALQASGAAADSYPQGVWWVPLASVSEPDDVLPAAARALGGSGPLADLIGDQRLLLLLDNFEHVIDAAPHLAVLLESCPELDVLVTSRERLRIAGEQVYPVPVLGRSDSRELFVARARAALPEFVPDEHVDELCARLDDLPLALELAAARTSLLTVEQLLDRLGERLDLLRGGRDAEVRQRTLRATIEWSYELLTPDEQRLLAALSVFRGGWLLETAERVCETDVELLESLADKSLVRRTKSGRFLMLETIREFATERADELVDRDALLGRLADYLLELADRVSRRVGTQDIERVAAERGNVDAVLEWALERGSAQLGLELVCKLEPYWVADVLAERRWVDAFLAFGEDRLDVRLRARAHRLRGGSHELRGEHALAQPEYEHAIELYSAAGDADEVAHIRHRLASCAIRLGDVEGAEALARDLLEYDRRRGRRRDEAIALSVLGEVATARGDAEGGVALTGEAAALARDAGWAWFEGIMRLSLAEQLTAEGDGDGAERALAESATLLARIGDVGNIGCALATAALTARLQGNEGRAGLFWGVLEAAAAREPTRGWMSPGDYAEVPEGAGPGFAEGCERGRNVPVEEALQLLSGAGWSDG